MTWGTTISGITATQRKFVQSMLRVPECRTDHLAKVFGVTNESAGQHLRALRDLGIVGYRRKKNVGWWSLADREGVVSLAWPLMAKAEGNRKRLPQMPKDTSDPDVNKKRMDLVDDLENFPNGIISAEVKLRHPKINSGDISWLRGKGYLHTKRRGNSKKGITESWFFPGKRAAE
ncbi:MAG: hypothetical protein ABJ360_22480 [Roseobacter sp.]